jgi:hypothetical protein
MPDWAEHIQAWASVGSLVVAIVAASFVVIQLRYAASALRAQNTSSDIGSVLLIWERLDQHWVRFREASSDAEKRFEFGQLISYYEMACSLFRDRVFTTRATRTLHEHLHEILPAMQRDQSFRALFDALRTDEHTFENITWFCQQPPPGRRSNRSSCKAVPDAARNAVGRRAS